MPKSQFNSWTQKILTTGYERLLTEDDIFPIDPRLRSERLTALLEQYIYISCQITFLLIIT